MDDLEGRWQVQPVLEDGEGAVPVHPQERTGVRQRRRARRGERRPREDALREGEERAAPAELHVDEEQSAGRFITHPLVLLWNVDG